jgi:RNA polymerase sigma-70 factor (ECF subfamily)
LYVGKTRPDGFDRSTYMGITIARAPYLTVTGSCGGSSSAATGVNSARDDAAIVALIKSGDVSGLEDLYDAYGTLTFTVAFRILGDLHQAEEAVQDAFHSVWRGAASFDTNRGTLRAWLLTILRNRCFDVIRSRAARPVLRPVVGDELVAKDDVERDVESSMKRQSIREALAQLSADHRQVLELAFYDGLSQSQMATALQLPLGTVKGRVRAAMQRLRALLDTAEAVG